MIFLAVCCFSCETFQVIQQNKLKKFVCKICSEKQSVRRVYGQSQKAKDVREIVQSLNLGAGLARESKQMMEQQNLQEQQEQEQQYYEDDDAFIAAEYEALYQQQQQQPSFKPRAPGESRWGKYMEEQNNKEEQFQFDAGANDDANEAMYVTALPEKKRGRTSNKTHGNLIDDDGFAIPKKKSAKGVPSFQKVDDVWSQKSNTFNVDSEPDRTFKPTTAISYNEPDRTFKPTTTTSYNEPDRTFKPTTTTSYNEPDRTFKPTTTTIPYNQSNFNKNDNNSNNNNHPVPSFTFNATTTTTTSLDDDFNAEEEDAIIPNWSIKPQQQRQQQQQRTNQVPAKASRWAQFCQKDE